MIRMIVATAMVATVFSGCVGTMIAKNDVKRTPSSAVQNAKCTVEQENNSSVVKKEMINKKVD
jgi:PBP1b-binding outer membrane lipoprotein LpoB